jgi:hypothetical protein
VQSLANTTRNVIVLFARLGRSDAAAVLHGWLDGQTVVLPGTAGMRARTAAAGEQVAAALGREAFEQAQARGAAMPTARAVSFLLEEIDQALLAAWTS